MQRWYVARGNVKEGPYSAADLRKLAQAGRVSQADMLLLEGSFKWVQASSIKGLFTSAIDLPEPDPVVVRVASRSRAPQSSRLFTALLLILVAAIAVGACWHFVRENQLQDQLSLAESEARAQGEKTAVLERQLADADAAAKETADQLQERNAEETAKAEVAKAEAVKAEAVKAETAKAEAKAREAMLAELQQRLAELDRKSRDSAALATALEEKLAEAVKKEREARLAVDRAQKQAPLVEKTPENLAAALSQSLGQLRKRLAQAEKDKVPYEFIDKHALDAPKVVTQAVKSLALYLTAPALDDTEKARAIFRWITANIDYDVDALFKGQQKDNSADVVLRDRKCVCEGYANLFCALAAVAGPETVKIGGYAKGWGYEPGEKIDQPNHAWVAVKLDETWRLIDPTWGAGFTNSEKVYVPFFNDFYFLTPPEQFIMSHLPSEEKWQLLPEPVTAAEFEKWGKVDHVLFSIGFSAKQVRAKLSENGFQGFVKAFNVKEAKVTILEAPLNGMLRAGDKFQVRLDAPLIQGAMITAGGKRVPMTQKGTVFEGRIDNLPAGLIQVFVQPASGGVLWQLLGYTANEE